MASELRVNTLKDASGNNSIATSFVAGGSAKCWGHVTQGTTALDDSFNCSSISDDATGRFTITRTTSMGNDDYCVAGAVMADRGGLVGANSADTFTASQTKFAITNSNDSGYQDYNRSCFQIMGDLA
jgi:hypothetical protein|tara:strand:- start:1320 stop:1700 length:381 start_codon:yes stop_codon:yes gene_type:complete